MSVKRMVRNAVSTYGSPGWVLDDAAHEAFDHRAIDLDDLVGHEAV